MMEADGALLNYKVHNAPCLRLIGFGAQHLKRDPFFDFGVFEAPPIIPNRIPDGRVRGIADSLHRVLGITHALTPRFTKRLSKLAAEFVDLPRQERSADPGIRFVFYVLSNGTHIWT